MTRRSWGAGVMRVLYRSLRFGLTKPKGVIGTLDREADRARQTGADRIYGLRPDWRRWHLAALIPHSVRTETRQK